MEFEKALAQLNEAQRQAVETIEGPVMVVAGPGTGKTQTLAMRIANILKLTDTPPGGILAMTFTESGARSMRERLVSMIGSQGYYVNIGTFHGFCSGVIAEHPEEFLISAESEPLSDLERIQIFTQILSEQNWQVIKPINAPFYYLKPLIGVIQNIKREGYDPVEFGRLVEGAEFKKEKDKQKLQETTSVYARYEELLKERGRFDYEDMIMRVIGVFEKNTELLREYQEQFLYVMADEYQDTNSAQNKLLWLLTEYWGQEANVFVVGDPNQAIYRFQGASLENVLEFKDRYPEATIVNLDQNYRSSQRILDAAGHLIEFNSLKSRDILEQTDDSVLRSMTEFADEPIKLVELPSEIVEMAWVGHEIRRLVDSGVNAANICVIYRDNADGAEIAGMLSRLGLRYNLEGGDDVLTTGVVRRLLQLMEAIVKIRHGDESVDLFTLLHYEFVNVDHLDVLKLTRWASKKRMSVWEAVRHEKVAEAGLGNLEQIKKVIKQLERWGELDVQTTLVEMFEMLLRDSGLMHWILESKDSVRKLNQINSLLSTVKRMNRADREMHLEELLERVALLWEYNIRIIEDDLDIDTDAVKLSTAHKIKGQEYDYVFIIKAVDRKWGNKRVSELIKLPEEMLAHGNFEKKEKNEDERRLFYVAVTRAKQQCYVTRARAYNDREVVESMFVGELAPLDSSTSNGVKLSTVERVDTGEFEKQAGEILKEVLQPIDGTKLETTEEEWLRGILKDFTLSVSALNCYLECPYRFKLDYLIKVPQPSQPVLAYGTAVHAALEAFQKTWMREGERPSVALMEHVFEETLRRELLGSDELAVRLAAGKEALKRYFAEYEQTMQKAWLVERWFGGRFHPVVVGDVPLVGKMDKIELVDEVARTVRVMDYKTGRGKTRGQIQGTTQDSDGGIWRQLVFYKLLADKDASFGYTVTEAGVDFVEADRQTGKLRREVFEISAQDVEELEALILETWGRIKSLEFDHAPGCGCAEGAYGAHAFPDGPARIVEVSGEQLRLV